MSLCSWAFTLNNFGSPTVLQPSAVGGLGAYSQHQTPVTCWLLEICHYLPPESVWRQGYFGFVVVTALVHFLLPLAPSVRSKLSHNWNSKLLFTFLFPFLSIPEVVYFPSHLPVETIFVSSSIPQSPALFLTLPSPPSEPWSGKESTNWGSTQASVCKMDIKF